MFVGTDAMQKLDNSMVRSIHCWGESGNTDLRLLSEEGNINFDQNLIYKERFH